jgi:hypothetical protein
MRKRKTGVTGWRKAAAVAGLTCALFLPAAAADAQVRTPTPTPRAVTGAPRGGEPVQDMAMAAIVLAALAAGGLTLRRFATRRA